MAAAATDEDLKKAKAIGDSKSSKDKTPAELFKDISFWLASKNIGLTEKQMARVVKNVCDDLCKRALPLYKLRVAYRDKPHTAIPQDFRDLMESYIRNPTKFNFMAGGEIYSILSECIRNKYLTEYQKAIATSATATAATASSPAPVLFTANATAANNTGNSAASAAANKPAPKKAVQFSASTNGTNQPKEDGELSVEQNRLYHLLLEKAAPRLRIPKSQYGHHSAQQIQDLQKANTESFKQKAKAYLKDQSNYLILGGSMYATLHKAIVDLKAQGENLTLPRMKAVEDSMRRQAELEQYVKAALKK